jgi:hypothetical protein
MNRNVSMEYTLLICGQLTISALRQPGEIKHMILRVGIIYHYDIFVRVATDLNLEAGKRIEKFLTSVCVTTFPTVFLL